MLKGSRCYQPSHEVPHNKFGISPDSFDGIKKLDELKMAAGGRGRGGEKITRGWAKL